MSNARRKEQGDSIKIRRLMPWVLGLLLVLVVTYFSAIYIWRLIERPSSFPIAHVLVRGDVDHVDVKAVTQLTKQSIHGGFFSLQLGDAKQLILENSWLTNVELTRVWPDTLVVSLTEKKAMARWGEKGVINPDGKIFYPAANTIDSNLPKLSGSDDKAKEMLARMIDFNKVLQPVNLSVKTMTLLPDDSWIVMLSNKITLKLGRKKIGERFDRFVRVYEKIAQKDGQSIAKIDCRYANGFAVLYK